MAFEKKELPNFEKSSICVLICHLTPGTVMKRPLVKPSKRKQGNSAEARKLGILEEGIDDDNDDDDDDDNVTIVDIPISFDGTWSKRDYTVNHCIGFVISAATGKVLDFDVISKVCQ